MFFKEGHNCWKVAKSERIAFLIDGEAYFKAFADACEVASQVIYIVGWDINSRIRLRRGESATEETFGEFVDRLARDKPDLHIYILEWDFAMLYTMERETWPLLSLGWLTHERVHFELDDEHPVGASHHQKIVVVDDRVAFVGGFDLASWRWDTSEHAVRQPERIDNQVTYGPFHDVQMMVDGDVARQLGQLVRKRWEQATGDVLPVVKQSGQDPWPGQVAPQLESASVAILRTVPEFEEHAEIREVLQFYLDAIDRAESFIYIENQYFTSHVVGKALARVLGKEDGPEVLLVLPRNCPGWLEQETMGALRKRLLQRLIASDPHGRLKICYPDRDGLGSEIINVHSKVLIVDNKLLTIGSANLSNRSMGFDTECNLALSADESGAVEQAIANLRNRLLAEHMGKEQDEIAACFTQGESLLTVVSKQSSGQRTLRSLDTEESSAVIEKLSADEIIDPERPIEMNRLLTFFGFDQEQADDQTRLQQKAWRFAALLLGLALMALLWRWSPLNQWLNMDALLAVADFIRKSPLTVPIVLLIYVVGSCVMFPITLMILATALSFGPYAGFALAFTGSLLGGLASYLMGRWLGRDAVRKLAGDKVNRISRKIARRGWLAIAVVRLVPIAPFTIVNMVAGATHISARSFLIGTAVGMGPGIMAIMMFEGGLEQAVRDPGWPSLLSALLAFCGAGLLFIFGKHWVLRRGEETDDG